MCATGRHILAAWRPCNFVVARQYSNFKEPIRPQWTEVSARKSQPLATTHRSTVLVGLGRVELPTSPLSGVRSSHLSYRPTLSRPCAITPRNTAAIKGCVGPPSTARAASTWWSWSGSNRRPPECKSGALPAELQPLHWPPAARHSPGAWPLINDRGRLDAGSETRSAPEKELAQPKKEMPKLIEVICRDKSPGPERLLLTSPRLTAAA